MKPIFTIALSGLIGAGTTAIPFLPEKYKAIVAGAVMMLSAIYHLYQPSPSVSHDEAKS